MRSPFRSASARFPFPDRRRSCAQVSSTQKGLARQPPVQGRVPHRRQRHAPVDRHKPQGRNLVPPRDPLGAFELPHQLGERRERPTSEPERDDDAAAAAAASVRSAVLVGASPPPPPAFHFVVQRSYSSPYLPPPSHHPCRALALVLSPFCAFEIGRAHV